MHMPKGLAARASLLAADNSIKAPGSSAFTGSYAAALIAPRLPARTLLPQLSTRLGMMAEAGVPAEQLEALGIGINTEQAAMSYGDTLRALPEEAGVQLEFWRSAEGGPAGAAGWLLEQKGGGMPCCRRAAVCG